MLAWIALSSVAGVLLAKGYGYLAWLYGVEVLAVLSPVVFLLLGRVRRSASERRFALSDAGEPQALTGLSAGLVRFAEQTRGVRLALIDAESHAEAVRELFDWLASFEGLAGEDEQLAAARGVGPGPVRALLRGASDKTPNLTDADIARAAAHLEHVEQLLGIETGAVYR